jgi:hypothetical protein
MKLAVTQLISPSFFRVFFRTSSGRVMAWSNGWVIGASVGTFALFIHFRLAVRAAGVCNSYVIPGIGLQYQLAGMKTDENAADDGVSY